MTWRMARSLDVLLNEVNKSAPNRDKASDGGIGDAAHASRDSDHNPWVKDKKGVGVVRARDFDDDPAGGMSAAKLADYLASQLGIHPALGPGAYVIWNRRIISTNRLREDWRPYNGVNAHRAHVHVSVGYTGYDSPIAWGWGRKSRGKRIDATLDLLRKAKAAATTKGRKRKIQAAIDDLSTIKEK